MLTKTRAVLRSSKAFYLLGSLEHLLSDPQLLLRGAELVLQVCILLYQTAEQGRAGEQDSTGWGFAGQGIAGQLMCVQHWTFSQVHESTAHLRHRQYHSNASQMLVKCMLEVAYTARLALEHADVVSDPVLRRQHMVTCMALAAPAWVVNVLMSCMCLFQLFL